jgi:glutathione S-transferase
MVLNFKGIPYTQSYISYPDIAPLLSHYGVTPHPTGAQYTLPAILHKPSVQSNPNGALMDSLAIATHLDQTYPSPPLFPSGDASYALTLAVIKLLSSVTQKGYALLIPKVADLLDHRGQQYFIETRSARFGKPLSEVYPKEKSEVQTIIDATKEELQPVAQMLRGRPGKQGPFFEGKEPGYADILVVSFLAWVEKSHSVLFQELVSIGEGEIKELWVACLPWVEGQGETKEWDIPN